MNWLNIKTEFSFGYVFGPIEKTVQILKKQGSDFAGICDINGTYGFVEWEKTCTAAGIKPIFGVQLSVVVDIKAKDRREALCEMLFIAKTNKGLRDLYKLTEFAHNQFYFIPRLSAAQVSDLDDNDVLIISGVAPTLAYDMDISMPLYLQYGPNLPYAVRDSRFSAVACIDNWYPKAKDEKIYNPFADDGSYRMERKTTPQWILSDEEYLLAMNDRRSVAALNTRDLIGKTCNAKLQKAPLISFPNPQSLASICTKGAKDLNIDLKNKVYKKRLEREILLIDEKGYNDYFLVVSDIITWAKKTNILVGPGRGSAGGSLVAFLMGITTVDPIKYDLIFERFIDVNRTDLPDIDVDFPDVDRLRVIRYMAKKYGVENVAQISNINKLQAKSTLNRVAKNLKIPNMDLSKVKAVLIERTSGDLDHDKCLRDTFKTTEEGKTLLKIHPNLKVAEKMEGHALHTGVHAAGVIVSNNPISNYCGINSKEKRVAMIDMREAEYLNLLKIDVLGLRTLSIIADVCKAKGIKQKDLYMLPDGDPKTYEMLNEHRYTGIFQLEGSAARTLASQMTMESIEDLAAISAVARPGPLQSGGAARYVDRKARKGKVMYTSNHKLFKKATKDTVGVIVYQEQVMRILKDLGKMSWPDVIKLRKFMGKSMGIEIFEPYKKKFIKGCKKNGLDKVEAITVWETLITFGKYGFNKSHSVAYGIISYWCAYLKAHYPMSFAVACLNHSKSDRDSILLLRDLEKYEGIKYIWFDKDISQAGWSFENKTIYGGFTSLHGIAITKARSAVELRDLGKPCPPGIKACIDRGESPLRYLYPARQLYGSNYIGGTLPAIEIQSMINSPITSSIFRIIGKVIELEISENDLDKKGGKRGINIKIRIEDDTNQILCFFRDPESVGTEKLKELIIDKDWIWLRGEFKQGQYSPYFIINDGDKLEED